MRFDEFASTRLPAVLRFAAVLTADRALAEDVVQEVLIRTSNRWDRIGQFDYPELYVRKMVVNEYLSWRRRSWRMLPGGSAAEVDDRVSPDHAAAHAEREALLAELAKLPRRQRAVLVLRYYEGLSDPEIANVRTFSEQKDTPLPESAGMSSSALVASYIKTAHWTVRRTTLNGRAALELSFTDNLPDNRSNFHVWVDAVTYLPLRETAIFGPPGQTTSSTIDDKYLPATAANLAKLAPPVPAGFRRVTQGT